jgi:hypothetical protein
MNQVLNLVTNHFVLLKEMVNKLKDIKKDLNDIIEDNKK